MVRLESGNNSLDNRSVWYRTGNTLGSIQNRKFNLIYASSKDRPRDHVEKWTLTDATFHVAGDPSWSPKGTSAIHAVWDGDITKIKAYLHGYSTFIAAETWHSPKININNSSVTVENSNNSIFLDIQVHIIQ